jgi:hypothetical protein
MTMYIPKNAVLYERAGDAGASPMTMHLHTLVRKWDIHNKETTTRQPLDSTGLLTCMVVGCWIKKYIASLASHNMIILTK